MELFSPDLNILIFCSILFMEVQAACVKLNWRPDEIENVLLSNWLHSNNNTHCLRLYHLLWKMPVNY